MNPNPENKISAWKWFWSPSNYGIVTPVSLIIYPWAITHLWGDPAVWFPIGLAAATWTACILYGIKDYKFLTKNNYIKKFGEK